MLHRYFSKQIQKVKTTGRKLDNLNVFPLLLPLNLCVYKKIYRKSVKGKQKLQNIYFFNTESPRVAPDLAGEVCATIVP